MRLLSPIIYLKCFAKIINILPFGVFMTRNFILALLAGSITTVWAAEPAPEMLGNIKATLHQTCGKNIEIQIAGIQGAQSVHTVITLKNNKTGNADLFISATAAEKRYGYDNYLPVRFDNLSKTFIQQDSSNDRPDIFWGGAFYTKGVKYKLSLGTHVYECGELLPFKGELANDLYGEQAN